MSSNQGIRYIYSWIPKLPRVSSLSSHSPLASLHPSSEILARRRSSYVNLAPLFVIPCPTKVSPLRVLASIPEHTQSVKRVSSTEPQSAMSYSCPCTPDSRKCSRSALTELNHIQVSPPSVRISTCLLHAPAGVGSRPTLIIASPSSSPSQVLFHRTGGSPDRRSNCTVFRISSCYSCTIPELNTNFRYTPYLPLANFSLPAPGYPNLH
ncbi:hypothetical protein DFH06DRAFT_109182 [Mycena polygramma]|nr:hypothetical protein DFH06DRAFT_109182 [Mycena polygramma]